MKAEAGTRGLAAQQVVTTFIECGVTHVVWLVDSESAFMYDALMDAERAGQIKTVPICREGEAIPLALGLLMGNKRPLILIQNTGFFESGDSLRGQAIDFELPLVLMIGYRGWRPERSQMQDTAAIYIEPVLDAYRVPHHLLDRSNFRELIPAAFREAEQRRGPVAILVPGEWER